MFCPLVFWGGDPRIFPFLKLRLASFLLLSVLLLAAGTAEILAPLLSRKNRNAQGRASHQRPSRPCPLLDGKGPPVGRGTERGSSEAQRLAGNGGTAKAKADKAAILWNRKKLEEFGCLDPAGMERLWRGQAPAIKKGEHAGDSVALDHVLPVALVPELRAAVLQFGSDSGAVERRQGGAADEAGAGPCGEVEQGRSAFGEGTGSRQKHLSDEQRSLAFPF